MASTFDMIANGDVLDGFVGALDPKQSFAVAGLWGATRKAQEAGEREIEEIYLNGLGVTDDDVEMICRSLISNGVPVRGIFLASNHIGDSGAAALARLLEDDRNYHCVLSRLDLRGNAISGKGCEILSKSIRSNVTLTTLDLSSNPLGAEGGLHLSQMLAENCILERLVVSNTEMREMGFIALMTVLRERNNTVRELSVGGQLLYSRDGIAIRHLTNMLETPPCMIRSLDLSKSRVGDKGAALLRGALRGHPTLRALDLSCNHIGITGGEALAALLLEGSALTELNLKANSVGDDGAFAFKAVLNRSKTLKMLDLRSNSIGDAGLEALAEGMECNASLECLCVWGNHFGQASLQKFAALRSGQLALMGMAMDVEPFMVDGAYHAAEKSVK